jgi:hypothetical protein
MREDGKLPLAKRQRYLAYGSNRLAAERGGEHRATKAMLDNVRAQTNLEIGTPRRGLGGLHKKSHKDFLRRISQERWQGTVGDSRVTGKAKGTEDKLGGGGFRNQGGIQGDGPGAR